MVTNEQIELFLERLNKMLEAHQKVAFPNLTPPVCVAIWGKRWVKIATLSDVPGYELGSVYCFIDPTNGDLLKSASWQSPAKHARGNINTPTSGVEYLGPYGAKYINGMGNYQWRVKIEEVLG